ESRQFLIQHNISTFQTMEPKPASQTSEAHTVEDRHPERSKAELKDLHSYPGTTIPPASHKR
ncbi:hypothetical protein, partial [Terriglobus sp. ADX1]|uniref:hypothetical protein n=1 Tax=Terriglobus sp. ADX1 TaxID=2794063 RepID=UPI002FE650D9